MEKRQRFIKFKNSIITEVNHKLFGWLNYYREKKIITQLQFPHQISEFFTKIKQLRSNLLMNLLSE